MTPTRRTLLKTGALTLIPLPLTARAFTGADLILHDSRHPATAAILTPGANTLDLSHERTTRFATIRTGLPGIQRLDALTTWSDHAVLAHELERLGFRRAGAARMGHLWRWSMARRAPNAAIATSPRA